MTTTSAYVSTPGEILLEEFLEPLGISQYRLAKAIHKPQSAISDIVNGRRAISMEMAWLLGQALGTTAEFWVSLEKTYQLKTFDPAGLPPVKAIVEYDSNGKVVACSPQRNKRRTASGTPHRSAHVEEHDCVAA